MHNKCLPTFECHFPRQEILLSSTQNTYRRAKRSAVFTGHTHIESAT